MRWMALHRPAVRYLPNPCHSWLDQESTGALIVSTYPQKLCTHVGITNDMKKICHLTSLNVLPIDTRGTLTNARRARQPAQAVGGVLLAAVCLVQSTSTAGASNWPNSPLKLHSIAYWLINDPIQYRCMSYIITKESQWDVRAINREGSSAFGLVGRLNEQSIDPVVQILNGIKYAKHRYQSICNGMRFHMKHGWW
jgi:hypothetical protein